MTAPAPSAAAASPAASASALVPPPSAIPAVHAPGPGGPFLTDTHAKALSTNLDHSIYGTFAEIGAGQEVARWFLRVGAASGTVAKTMSAYDKTVSDDIYGAGTRYVSRERLLSMLSHEYDLLRNRLEKSEGPCRRFFVFADTVSARNFKGDNEQHGWLGVRFQPEPGAPTSDILLHVNLTDPTNQAQQESLGVLGVNLIYAAFHQRASADVFLKGLFDGLTRSNLEVDVIELAGPAFEGQDARLWGLAALRRQMARALVFEKGTARLTEPSNVLRKRPLLVERGRFETLEPFHVDMMRASERQLRSEGLPLPRDPIAVFEMTIDPAAGAETADDAALLARIRALSAIGPVIVTDFPQTYLLVGYLRRHTAEPIRLAVGVSSLARLLHERFYEALPGSLLQGLGQLLATNVRVYAYPMPVEAFRSSTAGSPDMQQAIPHEGSDLVAADDLRPKPPLNHLYRYLRDAEWVVPLAR
jgi:hypothetical protein